MKKVKIVALAVVAAVLSCSLLALPAGAGAKIIDQFELDGVVYTVRAWSSTDRDQEISDILARKELDRQLTEKEIAELCEALGNIDYRKAVVIRGDCFRITHIELAYGYAMNFITTWSPGSRGLVQREDKREITQNGAVVAWANLVATFNQQPTSVTIEYSGTSSWVASGIPISWSITAIKTSGTSSSGYLLAATTTATATNPGGGTTVVPYNLSVSCFPG
ncbi:MAG: hypothetical protein FWD23_10010 [Oscillospiraceae bacterium]|nr:hypothetical protein [Oscillospiraceae bacterium]